MSRDFINDPTVGFDQAPAGPGSNSFANSATTITDGCALAAAASRTVRAALAGAMTHTGRAFRHTQEVAERRALGRECAQSPTVSGDSPHYGQRKLGHGRAVGESLKFSA